MIVEYLANMILSAVSFFGYFGVFILMAMESMIFPIPSEVVMPFAGFLIYSGKFTFLGVLIASSLGSLFGSLISYYMGKYLGRPIVIKYGKYFLLNKHHLELTERFFAIFGERAVLVSRFIPVVRHIISIPAGIAEMKLKKFSIYTLIGATIWNMVLAFLGFTVQVPGKRNTEKILEEARGLFGWGEDFLVLFKMRRSWTKGALGMVFNVLYVGAFILTLSVISFILHLFAFNVVSILFFIFFFMLVAFFGLKIRQTKKDLVVVETAGGLFTFIADIVFLPIVRAGRWMAMRAPRVNIFLFFFDFIVEAPFKAAIGIIESWLAFLREKKEEI